MILICMPNIYLLLYKDMYNVANTYSELIKSSIDFLHEAAAIE